MRRGRSAWQARGPGRVCVCTFALRAAGASHFTRRRRPVKCGSFSPMKTLQWTVGSWLAAAALVAAAAAPAPQTQEARAMSSFTLTSPDISPGGTIAQAQVFNSFGCKGGNVSPALKWSGAPSGTQSFALMVHDPDAPTGSGWWHWVVYNIPASISSLAAGA